MSEAGDVVVALTARVRPLHTETAHTWWLASTRVSEEHDRRRVAAELALRDALADVSAFAAVREARDAVEAGGGDPVVARQLSLLHDAMAPQQLPADLRAELVELEAGVESTFNAFRGTIDEQPVSDNEILRILRTSDDERERRAAWEASKQVGAEVADRVRTLARLRNRAARHLGHRDHFALTLATREMDETRLLATLAEVDAATADPFRAWKAALDARNAERFGTSVDALRPWHLDDPFFLDPPIAGALDLDPLFATADLELLTARTYAGLGLDVSGVLAASDLDPRAAKSQHAFCIDLDREGDVRVLSNNVPSERWAETMLHEFGHAVYNLGLDRELPWLLRDMHPLTTEAVAMLFGRLVRDPTWLHVVAGRPRHEVEDLAPRLAASRRASLLVFARWVLVMTMFERGLYADPDADLDRHWWDLVERYQGVRRPDGRHAPDWAAKIHLTVAPVYYHNYLYGELLASQLQAHLASRGGLVDQPGAGTHLRGAVFGPGAGLRWDELVVQATGEPLTARHLAAELAA